VLPAALLVLLCDVGAAAGGGVAMMKYGWDCDRENGTQIASLKSEDDGETKLG